jgi:hypothetical protein
MKTFLAQNQFISNSAVIQPPTAESAVASSLVRADAGATAAPISNPVAKATKGKAGTAGVNGPVRRSTAGTGLRVGEVSADLPATSEIMDATARRDEHPTDHIPEIFYWVRKLLKDDRRFVLDTDAFMAEVEEVPLFVRDGDHLRRWTA